MAALGLSVGQALEEAAANAAEEERRRLQTQTELQDRYKMDLEREKLVRLPSSTQRVYFTGDETKTYERPSTGTAADGGAGGAEVHRAGAVPAAGSGAGGHVWPTGGRFGGREAGQTGRGGRAQAAGTVGCQSDIFPYDATVMAASWFLYIYINILNGSHEGNRFSAFIPILIVSEVQHTH